MACGPFIDHSYKVCPRLAIMLGALTYMYALVSDDLEILLKFEELMDTMSAITIHLGF